jgi:hypothetical protein
LVKKNRRMTETNNKVLDKEKNKRNDNSGVSIRSPSSSIDKSKTIENVLIPQGGGSLGAFGCGVFKALAKENIKIDIIAGTDVVDGGSILKSPSEYLFSDTFV